MTDIFHTFEEAQNFCLSFISPEGAKERTLKRITTLMHLLGDPQKNLRTIHVTGSYGKSSTAYMIASMLEQKGFTVGLHTKPHLQSMTERICINRTPIPNDVFVRYGNKVKLAVEAMKEQPTYFELLVAIMLLYFSDNHVDVAVIEAGRGGRLDATNIGNSDMLVITNIYLVHTDILGATKKEILREKMGLARTHTKIIAGVTQTPLQTYMRSLAKPIQATVQFSVTEDSITALSVPPDGEVQRSNVALAICAAKNYTDLTDEQINAAFASMKFPGRFEVQQLGTNTIIMDSAHNKEKMCFLLIYLQQKYPNKKMTIILRQKNTEEMRSFQKILKPIAKMFLSVSLETIKNKQDIPVTEAIAYIKGRTDTLFLITGSMELIGKMRGGLSIPYTLK
ncbi:MAG: Mur ligase family protein [Microgenomates group bacterium]